MRGPTDAQLTKVLEEMTLEELSYTLGRYAGRNNMVLTEKKFGFSISKEIVQKIHDNKALERYLLGNEDN